MQSLRIPNGHSALVLGAGASGAACAKHLYRRGWKVTVTDTRTAPPLGDLATLVCDDFTLALGGMPSELVTQETDLVVISPGLSPYYSAAAPVVSKAKELGIDVVGEIELFARELKRLKAYRKYAPKVIAITGTNGKTTTTTMVGLMAANGGVSVCVAGNIGPNAMAELDKHNENNSLPDVWVLELSSFQLETTSSLACTAATFLNLTEDHVDWHGSIDAYAAAKAKIFAPSTARVVNRDDIVSIREGSSTGRSFGDSDPQAPGQWGITVENGIEWLSKIDVAMPVTGKKALLAAEDPQKSLLMPVDALQIKGRHNAMNALAALALIEAAGLNLAKALQVLKTYRGEAHRVQSVLTVGDIEFIDDSKGTNVGAVIAALTGLGKSGRKCALVMGGDGKGQDFSPLAEVVSQYARFVSVIGQDAEKIAQALTETGVEVKNCGKDFEAAVRSAYEAAQSGDAVLLSPACASWDMFKNYAERSAIFVDIAHAIHKEYEESLTVDDSFEPQTDAEVH